MVSLSTELCKELVVVEVWLQPFNVLVRQDVVAEIWRAEGE